MLDLSGIQLPQVSSDDLPLLMGLHDGQVPDSAGGVESKRQKRDEAAARKRGASEDRKAQENLALADTSEAASLAPAGSAPTFAEPRPAATPRDLDLERAAAAELAQRSNAGLAPTGSLLSAVTAPSVAASPTVAGPSNMAPGAPPDPFADVNALAPQGPPGSDTGPSVHPQSKLARVGKFIQEHIQPIIQSEADAFSVPPPPRGVAPSFMQTFGQSYNAAQQGPINRAAAKQQMDLAAAREERERAAAGLQTAKSQRELELMEPVDIEDPLRPGVKTTITKADLGRALAAGWKVAGQVKVNDVKTSAAAETKKQAAIAGLAKNGLEPNDPDDFSKGFKPIAKENLSLQAQAKLNAGSNKHLTPTDVQMAAANGDPTALRVLERAQRDKVQLADITSSRFLKRGQFFMDADTGEYSNMTWEDAIAEGKKGRTLVPTGNVGPTFQQSIQRLNKESNAPDGAIASLTKSAKAFDDANDRQIFATMLASAGPLKPDSTKEEIGLWGRNLYSQQRYNALSQDGKDYFNAYQRALEVMASARGSFGITSTEGMTKQIQDLLPGPTTPNSAIALQKIQSVKTLLNLALSTGIAGVAGGIRPPKGGGQNLRGTRLTDAEADDYLKRAGGDAAKARGMAKADGRTF